MAGTSSSLRRSPRAYLQGSVYEAELWYAIDIDSLSVARKRRHPSDATPSTMVNIDPDLKYEVQRGGTWIIIGEYIYAAGGFKNPHKPPFHPCLHSNNLVRRKIKEDGSHDNWELVSSCPKTLFWPEPVMFALNNSVYILGVDGEDFNFDDEEDDEFGCSRIGVLYNLDTKKWIDVKWNDSEIGHRFGGLGREIEVVVEKEGDQPTRLGLCCLARGHGRVLFFDGSEWVYEHHPNLALQGVFHGEFCPQGLESCKDPKALYKVAAHSPPAVYNATLYWFTYDLHLYGYDLIQKRWFASDSLESDLPALKDLSTDEPELPLLAHLWNGKFIMFVLEARGIVAMASLQVSKNKRSLNVSAEPLPSLMVDRSFLPFCAKTAL